MPRDWNETIIPQILCSLRCTPAHATKIPPAELLLGRELHFPTEINALEFKNESNLIDIFFFDRIKIS